MHDTGRGRGLGKEQSVRLSKTDYCSVNIELRNEGCGNRGIGVLQVVCTLEDSLVQYSNASPMYVAPSVAPAYVGKVDVMKLGWWCGNR